LNFKLFFIFIILVSCGVKKMPIEPDSDNVLPIEEFFENIKKKKKKK